LVDVFRNARCLQTIIDDTVRQGIGTLWTQLGVIDEQAAHHAESHGIRVGMNRCQAIEWPRLRSAGLL
jgi:predicted CoA-binding protein